MQYELLFDEVTHQYSLSEGGDLIRPPRKIPSVSQIIRSMGGYDYGDTARNRAAMDRGTFVHRITHFLDLKYIDEEDIPVMGEEYSPYVYAYRDFVRDVQFSPTLMEHRLFHPRYLYAGTIDRIGFLNYGGENIIALIDIKTGQYHPTTSLQLAGYNALVEANGTPVEFQFSLHLFPDGTYKLRTLTNLEEAWMVFSSALTVYKWKEENNIGYRTGTK